MAHTNRGLAQAYIRSAVERGWSRNRTYRWLRSQGLGYRRTDFLADFRAYRHEKVIRRNLQNVRKDLYLSERMYATPKYTQPRNYRYTVKVRFRHIFTREQKEMFTSVVSDTPLTPGESEYKAKEVLAKKLEESLYEITGATIYDAFKNEGVPAK